MKKILFLSAIAAVAFGAQAQYSDLYYHRTGDTIDQNPNNGYFEWWDWDQAFENDRILYVNATTNYPVTLTRYYTTTPLKIVGIAASIFGVTRPDVDAARSLWSNENINIPPRQEYLYLYEADTTGFYKVGELPYNLADTHRYLHLKHHDSYMATTCCRHMPVSRTVNLYEYYFDRPITVCDSFYVGASQNSRTTGGVYDSVFPTYLQANYVAEDTDCKDQSTSWVNQPCNDDPMQILYAHFTGNDTTDTIWTYANAFLHLVIYPIVEMDTTLPPADMCAEVAGVQTSLSGDCLTVSWDSWPRYTTLQLRYGPLSLPQSEWDTVAATGSTHTLCGVDTTQSHYGVSLRAYCASAGDTTGWSPLLWAPMVQSDNSIDDAETALAASVKVNPNPSSGTVTVESHHLLQRIEVVNARGMLVYSEPATGHRTTLDLAMLPDGSYITCIQTTSGTTCKRIILQ